MNHTGDERPETLAVLVAGGQGVAPAPHAVVGTVKSDNLAPPRHFAYKLDGGFHSAATALGKIGNAIVAQPLGHDGGHLPGQFGAADVGDIAGVH